MMDSERKILWLPFGGMITKILEHIGFNLEDDKLDQKYTRIGSNSVEEMRIIITKGVLSHNPLKGKKGPQVIKLNLNKKSLQF